MTSMHKNDGLISSIEVLVTLNSQQSRLTNSYSVYWFSISSILIQVEWVCKKCTIVKMIEMKSE